MPSTIQPEFLESSGRVGGNILTLCNHIDNSPMNDPFGIQQSLKNLGILESNLGSSTGLHWLDSGAASLASFSPADGKKIASVQLATEETYEAVVAQALVAFEIGRAHV